MRIAILGLGLIGGSLARGLVAKDQGRPELAAWSPSGRGPRAAHRDGVVDAVLDGPTAAMGWADVVVLAAPPLACLDLLVSLAEAGDGGSTHWGPLITDTASTKAAIVTRADDLGLRFVGGHPMAGKEIAGYEAADPDLFRDRPWVVVPGERAAAADLTAVEGLATAVGARPVRMTAGQHDAASAAISHLPLVMAAALVEAVVGPADGPVRDDWATAGLLAASGWASMTRLARSDVEMATGILATNSGPVVERLRDLRSAIDAWLSELDRADGPDAERLRHRLGSARRRVVGDGGP